MATHGKVWSRFTKIRNGIELKFRTEELPQDKFEDVFNLFYKYYVPQEPLHKASKLSQSSEAFKEYKQNLVMVAKMMNYLVHACYLEDSSGESQVVGGAIIVPEKKNNDDYDAFIETMKNMIQSEEMKTLVKLASIMMDTCKIFDKFNFDSYYGGAGLVVHEDYRGLGIAGELLKIRPIICKERGIPITSAWMTSIGTQKAAAKLGWETISELQYEDFGKMAGIEFEGVPPSCKLMVQKVY